MGRWSARRGEAGRRGGCVRATALGGALALAGSASAAPETCLDLSAGPVLVSPSHPFDRDHAAIAATPKGWAVAWHVDGPSPAVALRFLADDLWVTRTEQRLATAAAPSDSVAVTSSGDAVTVYWSDGARGGFRTVPVGGEVHAPPEELGHGDDLRPTLGLDVARGADGLPVVAALRGTDPVPTWSTWRVRPDIHTQVDVRAPEGTTVASGPGLAVDGAGVPWIAWVDGVDAASTTLHVVSFGEEDPGKVVDVATGAAAVAPRLLAVDGGFVVLWATPDAVQLQHLDARGLPQGSPFVVWRGAVSTLSLAPIGTQLVAAWSDGDVGLRVIDAEDPDRCAPVTAHLPDAYAEVAPQVVGRPDGAGVVIWQGPAPLDATGVWGRRFTVRSSR